MNTNTTKTATRWLAGFVMAAGLGTAIFTGGAVASADTGTATNTNVTGVSGPSAGTEVGPADDAAANKNLQEQVGVKKTRWLMDHIGLTRGQRDALNRAYDHACAESGGTDCHPHE